MPLQAAYSTIAADAIAHVIETDYESRKVLAIDRQHWLDWVDPQRTNSPLYKKAWMNGFVAETPPV